MKQWEITIGSSEGLFPQGYISLWNGTKVLARFTVTPSLINIHFEPPPLADFREEITIGVSAKLIPPDYLSLRDGVEVLARFTATETKIHVQFEPPPPAASTMERLRQEFVDIVPHISSQSQEILWFMLNDTDGWALHQALTDCVWKNAEKEIKPGTVRKAISTLNSHLVALNFGYIIQSRQGIYRLALIER